MAKKVNNPDPLVTLVVKIPLSLKNKMIEAAWLNRVPTADIARPALDLGFKYIDRIFPNYKKPAPPVK